MWVFPICPRIRSNVVHQQPSFNNGQRVTHKGGYAIPFDTTSNKWGVPHPFDPLTNEENVDELLFTLNGQIYLLLFANFGQIAPLTLYRWDGKGWTQENLQVRESSSQHAILPFQVPVLVPASPDSDVRVSAHIVDDTDTNGRYVIFTMEHIIHLYRLSLSNEQAVIEPVADVPKEVVMVPCRSSSAVRTHGKVIISFMSLGCGYRWVKNRFIVFDEETRQIQLIVVSSV